MPKRFTATEKWDDPWFRRLKVAWKAAWLYLTDRCDTAGVIDLDTELADFHIGEAIDWEAFFVEAGERRIIKLDNGKIFLPGFIKFQYGELKPDCIPHRAIIKVLEKHSIQRVPEGYMKGCQTPQDKDKTRQDKKGGVGERPKHTPAHFTKPTLAEVSAYCRERGKGVNAEQWYDHYESNGWRVGRNAMKDWKAAVRKWEHSEYGVGKQANPPPAANRGYRTVTPEEFDQMHKAKRFCMKPKYEKLEDGRIRWTGQTYDRQKIEMFTEQTT